MVCAPSGASAGADLVELSDAEMDSIRGGVFEMNVDLDTEVLTFVQGNTAHSFGFEIGNNAFRSAQGVFSTVMAVNSAVDLDVVVNIYLNRGRL